MIKLILLIIISFSFSVAFCQQNILVFKKSGKELNRFWKGSTIAFQLRDKQWDKGEITKIQNDSFYIRPMVIRYSLMSSDTVHFAIRGYALTDVFAMPNKGILIDFIGGHFQISTTGGHLHFYWIKSGWIFRVGAAGYAGLNIANGLINKKFSFAENKTQLLAAAVVFLGGIFLHKAYKPFLQVGRKYQLNIFTLSD